MITRHTTAEAMARSVGVDPDTFRAALRSVKYPRKRGTDWKAEIDSPAYEGMRTVLVGLLLRKAA